MSCPTPYDPVNCSPPDSSVHGILQARILEWVAISFSRVSSQPRDRILISCLASRFFTTETSGKPLVFVLVLDLSRRKQWQPTPVLLPGKSHGQRSLVGCNPWGHEESDMTERLHFHFSLSCVGEGNGNPLQCSWRIPGTVEPGGLPSMGSHRVGHN